MEGTSSLRPGLPYCTWHTSRRRHWAVTLPCDGRLFWACLFWSSLTFIQSQGIGTLDVLAGQAESVLRAASEVKRTLEPFRPPNSRPPWSVAPSGPAPSRRSFGPGSRRQREGGGASSGARFRPRFRQRHRPLVGQSWQPGSDAGFRAAVATLRTLGSPANPEWERDS